MSGLILITPPAVEPITLADARAHLRVDDLTEDAIIGALITAARQDLDGREGRLGAALITQIWDLTLDAFPPCEIRLPLRPLQSIVSIKYDDAAGVEQTLDPATYTADLASYGPRVVMAPGAAWPAARQAINSVRVRFRVGYGDAPSAVPAHYRQAMLLLIGLLYDNRGELSAALEIPSAYYALIGVRGRVAS